MDNVNSASSINPATLAGFQVTSELTPEAILLYCQTRLNDINDRVNSMMDKQTKLAALQRKLNAIQTALPTQEGRYDRAQLTKVLGEAESDMKGLGFSTGQLETIRSKTLAGQGGSAHNDEFLNQSECDSLKSAISAAINDVSKSQELDMIQLQSAVQQRQTAIQLSTNLMNTISEAAKAIVQNIRT